MTLNKTIVDASHIQRGSPSMFENTEEEEENEKKENYDDDEVTPLATCEPTLCDTSPSTNRRSESSKKATTKTKRSTKKRTHQRISTETAESSGDIQEATSPPLMKKAKTTPRSGGGFLGGGGVSPCHKYETLRLRYHHLLHDFHHLRSRYERNVPESRQSWVTCSECAIPLTCHQCGHSKEVDNDVEGGGEKKPGWVEQAQQDAKGSGVRVIILR